MRFLTIFLLLISTSLYAQKTGRKIYFIDSTIFKPTDELVVIVNGPQSKFAEELGSRIYRDSNVINKFCSTFYEQIEYDSSYVEVTFYCGFDLFFYLKRGNQLYGFRVLNSDCEYYKLGGKENMNLLSKYGENLKIDTLTKGFSKRKKEEVLHNTLSIKHLRGEPKKYDMAFDDTWYNYSNGNKYPIWYYDGSVTVNIDFYNKPYNRDTVISFLNKLGIVYSSVDKINWQTSDDFTKGNVTIYLKKELFPYFENYSIHEFNKKDYKNFIVIPDKKYILYKTN